MNEWPVQCQEVVARPEGQQSASMEAYQASVVTMRSAPMLEGRVGPVVARDRQALRLDQHARWCVCAETGDRRAPPFSFGVDLLFAVVPHFQAVQPRQQDRSGQAGGASGSPVSRATA
jgi:hypothetical protein